MSDYELVDLIMTLEKTGVEYGQYIMAGIFAFVVTVFLLGQKMTKLMLGLVTTVYSAYVFFLISGVVNSLQRAGVLAQGLEHTELATLNTFSGAADGYYYSSIALSSFWLLSYLVSIVFLLLVRKRKLVHESA